MLTATQLIPVTSYSYNSIYCNTGTRRYVCQSTTLSPLGPHSQQQIVEHFLFVFCTVITIRQVSYACLTNHATPQKRSGKPPILSLEQTAQLIAFVTSSRLARQMTYLALSLYFKWNVGMLECTRFVVLFDALVLNDMLHDLNLPFLLGSASAKEWLSGLRQRGSSPVSAGSSITLA
jgi:hypothetical protein